MEPRVEFGRRDGGQRGRGGPNGDREWAWLGAWIAGDAGRRGVDGVTSGKL